MIVDDRIIIIGSGVHFFFGLPCSPTLCMANFRVLFTNDELLCSCLCLLANINDRSQLGYRDSEIAIIIEDSDMIPSKMNGVDVSKEKKIRKEGGLQMNIFFFLFHS